MRVSKKQKISILLLVILAFQLLVPGIASADTDYYMEPVSDSDYNFIVGDTGTIHMRIYGDTDDDDDEQPFDGTISSVSIYDPNGDKISCSFSGGSNLTVSNVLFDTTGTYELYVKIMYKAHTNSATYTTDTLGYEINVLDAEVTTSGTLIINDSNPTHMITATLKDSTGKILSYKELTVDGSEVGVTNSLKLTTDSDGQIKYSMAQMTPIALGNIKYLNGDSIVGLQAVQAAYTAGSRLGESVSGNTSLSVKVSQEGWKTAANVILTRDDVLVDALTAVPLSKKLDAPILMTSPTTLDNTVLQEIKRLGTVNIYLAGGPSALSTELEQSLRNEYYTVIRLSGSDRYETAAKIANIVGCKGTAYLASGYGEPDALAVAAFAAEQGNPILLTERSVLPAVTLTELQTLTPENVNILGGIGVVSTEIENLLQTQYAVERWGGADRYGTEQIIFQHLFTGQSPLYFASALVKSEDLNNGTPYGDALLTAALAAKKGGFMVTVPPDNLPSAINTFLLFNKGYISSATIVGNKNAISANLEKELQALLEH
ncbi:MAG TPA: cell wall-binding repeat-containing protein [Desulfitobacteriaceae bacterium]|nr:cell wall-binding repeat-containing protein [Desulfitobacteriaceae bacterium]